ncbi:MAG: SLC13 family permease, partial [Candidatus Binatia bacterium]
SQLSFLYLMGGEYCLIGWNLLPGAAKSEFGWTAWFLAALPAGILTLIFVFCALLWLFPLRSEEKQRMANTDLALEIENSKPFSRQEWIALITLLVTITGWLTMPMHGIGETWIAVAALLVFHVTGLLTKEIFTRKLDWGLILFFGIVTSMAGVTSHLKVDRWFITQIEPALTSYALGPLPFLAVVVVLVNIARLFIRKSPVVTFFMITMVPIAHGLGVHPGALLLTIVMASESFFVSYQDGPYQIAYSSTGGQAFSHTQARKLLLAKSAATLFAIAASVPYWRMLGLIH